MQQYKEEYQSIHAPERLKMRVKKSISKPYYRPILSAAACFVLITVLTVFSFRALTDADVALYYEGKTVSYTPVDVIGNTAKAVAFGAKSITPSGIPLSVKAAKDTKISVSGGTVQIFDTKGTLLFVGTDFTLSDDADVRWDISGLTQGEYTLTLSDTVYTVSIDDTITLKQEN